MVPLSRGERTVFVEGDYLTVEKNGRFSIIDTGVYIFKRRILKSYVNVIC